MKNKKFIPVANPTIGKEEAIKAYNQIKSGWFSMGKRVVEFERLVEKFTGAKYAIAVNKK